MLACLSHFGNRFMVVEVGPEHPELVVGAGFRAGTHAGPDQGILGQGCPYPRGPPPPGNQAQLARSGSEKDRVRETHLHHGSGVARFARGHLTLAAQQNRRDVRQILSRPGGTLDWPWGT